MARLDAPVTKTRRVAPAARASSVAYWISGLSTTGSISLGLALVAGRKRVPNPATGKTALVIFFMDRHHFRLLSSAAAYPDATVGAIRCAHCALRICDASCAGTGAAVVR